MTNEYAIKVLTELRSYGDKFANIGFDRKEAIDLAIKALEQQPCEDCISLNKLDDIITKAIDESENQTECQTLRWVLDVMSELPSVTPKTVTDFADKCKECGKILNDKLQTRWIPVSKRLPKKDETEVLITIKEDGSVLQATYLDDRTFDTEAYGWFAIKDIAAWMPLPKSYEESEDAK